MRSLTVAALAIAVLLAGCGGAVQSGPTTQAAQSPTTAAQSPPPTANPADTPAPTETSTTTAPSPTTEAWSPPDTPEPPIENATEDGSAANRIDRVRFYGTENGSGFSEFDVAVYGNTSTATFGHTVEEESAIEAYYFVWIEGEPVARTDVASFENESLTTVSVPEVALGEYDPGRLTVRIELLEADEGGTDRYGAWNGTVEWRPTGNESASANESA